jgi:hypothetical protein
VFFSKKRKTHLGKALIIGLRQDPIMKDEIVIEKKSTFFSLRREQNKAKAETSICFQTRYEEGKRTLAGKSKTQDINRNLKGKIKSNECRYGTEAHQLSGLQKGQFLYCKNERARVER